jgi:signal transduction histidine kinase
MTQEMVQERASELPAINTWLAHDASKSNLAEARTEQANTRTEQAETRSQQSEQTHGKHSSTERKVQRGFVFALACLAVIGVVSYFSIVRLREDAAWVQHTDEVIIRLELLFSGMTDAQNGHRGYAVTGDETYLEPYRLAVQTAESSVRRLRELTADNPAQQKRLDLLAPLISEQLAFGGDVIASRRSQGFEAARSQVLTGKEKRIHDQLRGLVDEMKGAEEDLLKEREFRARQSTTIAQTVIIGGGVLAFGFVGLASFTIRRDFAGRKRAQEDLREAKEQLEVRVRDRTAELAQLNVELEQRVFERTAQLQAANQELEAFSYSVSHDLRSPLRTIDGFSKAVLEEYGSQLPPQAQHDMQSVRDGAQQMGALIDDLLTFSRLSRQPLNRRTMDTGQLVGQCLEELRPQTQGRQIELRVAELPTCWGDPSLLKQVWINLLSNALKYSSKREPAIIEVGTIAAPTSGAVVDAPSATSTKDQIAYSVRDNGVGFDMRYASKLFGVFERLHRAEDYEGTGVGLATVQRIIHRHGGRIWAEAAVDRGATFYFTVAGEIKS